jgi:signal transduction histidine kinase
MNSLKRISLRMRITLLSGAILLLCSAILTFGAAYNARIQFNEVTLNEGSVTAVPGVVMPEEQTEYYLNDADFYASSDVPMLTAARKQFDIANILILAVVSALGMYLVYVVAGRSLRPIRELSRAVSEITEDNLRRRIPDGNRRDEAGQLGRSFNTMLDRLEASFLRQKRFALNAAHELKTPLATINAGIQVLRLDENPSVSDYKQTLASAERNIKRLMAVVDDLLSLYEHEEIQTEPADLENLFQSILSELRTVLEEKEIQTELYCGLKTVRCQKVLLYRACFNLVENAAKYNRERGAITIQTGAEDGCGRIVVSDTGGGIPEDELRQIFEPFYRVNKSRSRKAGGAGLGLSIVKAIVEKHGWQISVDSTVGRGSAFTISFPL